MWLHVEELDLILCVILVVSSHIALMFKTLCILPHHLYSFLTHCTTKVTDPPPPHYPHCVPHSQSLHNQRLSATWGSHALFYGVFCVSYSMYCSWAYLCC